MKVSPSWSRVTVFRGRVGGLIFLNAMARVRVERSPRCLCGPLGRFLGHGRQEGAWGTPVTRRKENDASYEGGSSRLKSGPLTRSARCDCAGRNHNAAVSSASLSLPPSAGPSWNHNAAVRVSVPEGGPAKCECRIRPANVEVRMSKCESARRSALGEVRISKCARPIANVEVRIRPATLRVSVPDCDGRIRPAKCPGESARRSVPADCDGRIRPARTGRRKSASLETATLSAGEGGDHDGPGSLIFLSLSAWRVCYLSFAVGCEPYDKPLWLAFSCL